MRFQLQDLDISYIFWTDLITKIFGTIALGLLLDVLGTFYLHKKGQAAVYLPARPLPNGADVRTERLKKLTKLFGSFSA